MVTDFGLAKRQEFDTGLTRSDTILGTASYMAPEQAHPTRSGLTTAADLERFRAGDAISLRRLGLVGRARRWARRNRLAAALLTAVAGLMALVRPGRS